MWSAELAGVRATQGAPSPRQPDVRAVCRAMLALRRGGKEEFRGSTGGRREWHGLRDFNRNERGVWSRVGICGVVPLVIHQGSRFRVKGWF